MLVIFAYGELLQEESLELQILLNLQALCLRSKEVLLKSSDVENWKFWNSRFYNSVHFIDRQMGLFCLACVIINLV